MRAIDYSLYAITMNAPALGRTHADIAEAAARGGASVIQFREKTADDAEFAWEAKKVAGVCRRHGIPFIVNDRIKIAARLGADGIHIGASDAAITEAREEVPPGTLIGVSATTFEEAVRADGEGADYIGVGPVFPTSSKDDAAHPIGLDELARICLAVSAPVVAIGGITQANIKDIRDAGAAGGAVIAAIAGARDMEKAARLLRKAWEKTT